MDQLYLLLILCTPGIASAEFYTTDSVKTVTYTHRASASSPDPVVGFINRQVQMGALDPKVAVELMRAAMSVSPEQKHVVSAAEPVQPEVSESPVPAWALDASKTVMQNMLIWSNAAGGFALDWRASKPYSIEKSSTALGAYPDVLRNVADETGLNICANPGNVIRVTDPNVPCY